MDSKIIQKFKIRRGGYMSYLLEDSEKEGVIKLDIINNNISNFIINYNIMKGGYLHCLFWDIESQLLKKIELEGNNVKYICDLLDNVKMIEFIVYKSIIYQII